MKSMTSSAISFWVLVELMTLCSAAVIMIAPKILIAELSGSARLRSEPSAAPAFSTRAMGS